MPAPNPLLLTLAGPAGSGKSTLCDRLVAAGLGFSRVITTTTRKPREGEVDGVHYHFFRPDEFEARVARGEFLEWAWVHADQRLPHDPYRRYGTLKSSVHDPLARGQDLVMSIDVQGVAKVRAAAEADPVLRQALVTVFIRVDHERLLARMRLRGQDNDAEIARRMATAEAELREASTFDHVIESRTREEDFGELLRIVTAARVARGRLEA